MTRTRRPTGPARDAAARRAAARRGAAVVELAVCLPVFLLVVFAVIEFGRAMTVAQVVANAAREGGRRAILSGATNQSVRDAVVSQLKDAAGVKAGDVSIDIKITPAAGNPNPGGSLSAARTGDLVEVRIEVPFDRVTYLPAKYLAGKRFVGLTTMRHE